MVKKDLTLLSDEELISELQGLLKKSNIIELNQYFSDPKIDSYFKEIYQRYNKRIEYYCGRFIHDKDLVSDIFHDIFIKIYLNIHRYHYKKNFKAWVYKIAHNSCINYIRKNKNLELSILNKKITNSNSLTEYIDLFETSELHIENKIINNEIKEAIKNAVSKLPVNHINVFLLKTDGGLTFDEIAKIEKASSRNIKTIYHNALLFIKEELKSNNLNLHDLKGGQ